MFIIVNKDFSLANITPSTVYQGSNLANELAIFAPFSISSYSAVEIAVMLPSGKYLTPSLAFPSVEQPDGFGAWSMLLPSTVTAIPGTVRLSLSFIGAGNAKMVTEAAEFTVAASVPSVMPETPSQDIYDQILSYVSEVLNRKPNWSQTNPNADDYIANKPPIAAYRDGNGQAIGVDVEGSISATSATIGGVAFTQKLDKATSQNGTSVYAVEGSNQKIIRTTAAPSTSEAIPLYSGTGTLRTYDPSYDLDAVNLRYLQEQLRNKVLPTWVSNLKAPNINATTTIPPTSGAVIRYASPAIIGEQSGTAILVDDFSDISGQTPITVTAPEGVTSISVYGKNLFDMSKVTAQVGSVVADGDSLVWTTAAGAIGTFVLKCPISIPANVAFSFSLNWVPSSTSDALGRLRFYNGNTEIGSTPTGATSGTFIFDQPVTQINIYKNPSNTALSAPVTISQPTVNIGTLASYTDYKQPVVRNVPNGDVTFAAPYSDGITVIPNTPAVISASYTRDSTKVINKLFELIAEIQDAIAN